MAGSSEEMPLIVRKTIGDWVRRGASGTIQLSFHKGVVKTITPAEVIHVGEREEGGAVKRSPKMDLRIPRKIV